MQDRAPGEAPSLNPRYPLNFRTAGFAVLVGMVMSIPLGMLRAKFTTYEPPHALVAFYLTTVSGAWMLLPFGVLAVWKYSPLPLIGVITFLIGIALLFPPME